MFFPWLKDKDDIDNCDKYYLATLKDGPLGLLVDLTSVGIRLKLLRK